MSNDNPLDVSESEVELIDKAQDAVSHSNWIVGECAAKWTKKYARGRTDADFGKLVGLSGDQVYQRRRVWESFADVYESYDRLKWSHFYVALNWNDAPECLQWAQENETTVAEMKAWRRAQRGEDLTQDDQTPMDEWAGDLALNLSSDLAHPVRDPDDFEIGSGREMAPFDPDRNARDAPETVPAFARDANLPGGDEGAYSPFRPDAGGKAPGESEAEVAVLNKPKPSPEQVLKRIISSLERLNRSLTPEMISDLQRQPEKQRNRLMKALGELNEKLSDAGF